MHSEASKPAPNAKPAGEDIAARLAGLSPEKLKLLSRELKKRKAGIATPAETSSVASSTLVPIRSSGSLLPLFLVHPAGGGVAAYHDLAKYLSPEQPVFALQNLDSRIQPPRIEDMAALYIEAIQPVCPNGPYVLGGSSLGGVVAFEMAVQLKAHGRRISLVAMLDAPARIIRHMRGQEGHSSLAVELVMFASIIASGRQTEFQLRLGDVDPLQPEEQINRVFNQLKQQQLVLADLSPSVFRAALTAFVSNLNALEKYVPGSYDGRVAMVRAKDTSPNMKASAQELCDDPAFGWQPHCKRPITVRFVPGDHVLMNLEPNVRFTGAELQRFLNEAKDEAKEDRMEAAS